MQRYKININYECLTTNYLRLKGRNILVNGRYERAGKAGRNGGRIFFWFLNNN
jgi:hypothetical protein